MEKNFDLYIILTVTTGLHIVDDFNKAYRLAEFVFDMPKVTFKEYVMLVDELKDHLLKFYPQLKEVEFKPARTFLNLDENIKQKKLWVKIQKIKFGDELPICKFGEQLNNEQSVKIK